MKFAALVAVNPLALTAIGPVEAPSGTMATISVVERTSKVAGTPLKVTLETLMKLLPVIVTAVPISPLPGENPKIKGWGMKGPVILNCCEILKKMFPRPTILILESIPGTSGIVTVSDPSLGVSSARTIGKLLPLDRNIETLAQFTGALVVFATFHVTVCCVFPAHSTLRAGWVTVKGPLFVVT
jgi:hypothetical protein